ncbi:SpaH/EbpB family LPXTG-anchored major pilin [Bifidobacterium moukalabense]|uniref:SpaH/EbpB family LPXTG-anchored major pilin n=1 Tax=Bifidobacterium moukalabense TaxID=1333651 RepID=UPI0010F69724|nr:SpaH/EbpB family LPXTG-anchored major pilin [Bifidobacterium moukalabense]
MKGSLKKALTAVAAGVLAIGMAVSGGAVANADDAVTKANLTIQASDANTTSLAGRTFAAYRVLTIDSAGTGNKVAAKVNAKYETALKKVTKGSTESDILTYINGLDNDSKVRTFAEALRDEIVEENVPADVTISGEDSKSVTTPVDFGWYIIDETTDQTPNSGTKDNAPVSLVKATIANRDVTIDLKGGSPTSAKNIVDDSTGDNPRKVDDYNINDDIVYQLNFTIPEYWSTQYAQNGFWFTMNDQLSDGLTFDRLDSIKVGDQLFKDVAGYDSVLTVNGAAATDEPVAKAKLSIAFGSTADTDAANNKANLKLAGKTVTVYYHAHLNGNAVIAGTGNPNTYNVTYQRSPYTIADGEDTPVDTPRVYTYKFQVLKYDADEEGTSVSLAGAEFKLYADEAATQEVPLTQPDADKAVYQKKASATATAAMVTDSEGHIAIHGLDAGTYYLKETKAPSGYMLSNTVTKVVIARDGELPTDGQSSVSYKVNDTSIPDTSYATVAVGNHKGTLPSTGGMGIAFMVAAGIALIAAGAFSIMRRRA